MPIPHHSEDARDHPDCSMPSGSSPMQTRRKSATFPERLRMTDSENVMNDNICTDRAELIERIKRGESPTWVPNPTIHQEYLKERCHEHLEPLSESASKTEPRSPSDASSAPQPPAGLASPFELERPRSALHAGDFNDESRPDSLPQWKDAFGDHQSRGKKPNETWHRPSPAPLEYETVAPWSVSSCAVDQSPLIGSFSSNFVLKVPTTPLVQQLSNPDEESPSRDRSASPDQVNRRHTLPPHALREWPLDTQTDTSLSLYHGYPSRTHSREPSSPRFHRPHRSVTSIYSLQQPASPPTPAFRTSRRTSFSSEASSRHRASMVGSYEESILHGRMSTPPSKPFDFTAHIGALGRGKKPKMPAHVTVPFQAVFYDWTSSTPQRSGSSITDEPSPYVGFIDLRNMYSSTCTTSGPDDGKGDRSDENGRADVSTQGLSALQMPQEVSKKRKRHVPDSPKSPIGGYRIPEQGQVQVVVKNPYKTALKLFLVPYDLKHMEPGQKTFIRQRYYSAGPILERPVISEPNLTARASRALNKSTLRYLIHLKICCPSKGRYYVYDFIRVVFANRVPDDKEHLTKEVQEPNPKYSLWKPQNEPPQHSPASTKHPKDVAFRRRSSGVIFGGSTAGMRRSSSHSGHLFPYTSIDIPPVPPIPFHLPPLNKDGPATKLHQGQTVTEADLRERPVSESSCIGKGDGLHRCEQLSSDSGDSDTYMKLQKGEAGYGGLLGYANSPEPGEGLLARRLRSLDVHQGHVED